LGSLVVLSRDKNFTSKAYAQLNPGWVSQGEIEKEGISVISRVIKPTEDHIAKLPGEKILLTGLAIRSSFGGGGAVESQRSYGLAKKK